MGSSPVTATTFPGVARDRVLAALRPLVTTDDHGRARRLVVAFSGGPDSTALLWGLTRLAARQPLQLVAAHLDHALDPGSGERAARARAAAGCLGVPFLAERRAVATSGSVEANARRERYGFLEEVRLRTGSDLVATGHHLDDQVETVLLRLLSGSGIAGLGGMRQLRDTVVRPLLGLDRVTLEAAVRGLAVETVEDPANRDLSHRRSAVRHGLLPAMRAADPSVGDRLVALAAAARGASARVDDRVRRRCPPRRTEGRWAIPRAGLESLPRPLWPWALALLHRRAGLPYPPPASAVAELERQVDGAAALACACGGGWSWREGRAEAEPSIVLLPPRAPIELVETFTYTLPVPGEVKIAEIGLRIRVGVSPTADWMWKGDPVRAGLAPRPGAVVTVRSRRPGDRVRPLGCAYDRKLKDVLIDAKVPRDERDRLPLLCIDDEIAWVPGVTIADEFKLPCGRGRAWLAEIERTR